MNNLVLFESFASRGYKTAYGGVVTKDGMVLLREPANHYDDYVWTFPKGRNDAGETPEETALREVLEETGVHARIMAPIPGDFLGGTTINRYFLMEVVEETNKFDWETNAIRWATVEEAHELIQQTTNPTGVERDLAILAAVAPMLHR